MPPRCNYPCILRSIPFCGAHALILSILMPSSTVEMLMPRNAATIMRREMMLRLKMQPCNQFRWVNYVLLHPWSDTLKCILSS